MPVIHKTYQLRAYTSAAGYGCLVDVLRNCARLYNAALEEWKVAYRHKGHSLSASLTKFDQMKELTGVRKDDPEFWGALSLQIPRGVIVRLERARQSFFRRVATGETPGFPRFKAGRRWRTIEIAEPSKAMVKQRGSVYFVRVKGLPTLRVRKGVNLPPSDRLKVLTITMRGRRLWVNLTYSVSMEALPKSDDAVGIDMGVSDRLTLSTGEAVSKRDKPNDRLIRAQRRLSACRKGSRKWRQRRSVLSNAQHRERIRNRNECHRTTTELVRRFDFIAVEDLQVKNMTASAKGTAEQPGRHVRQKAGLNRSITEQTWGIIRQQLSYKAAWAGRKIVAVDPKGTSQTCSVCGAQSPEHRDGKAYNCLLCGMQLDADVNAAINILHRGLARGNKVGYTTRAAALDAA